VPSTSSSARTSARRATPQPDGLAMLVAGLMAEGITKDQIKLMGRETPGKLPDGLSGTAATGGERSYAARRRRSPHRDRVP
jgi:hypothetical protein